MPPTLATVDDVKRYLTTEGTVSVGAHVDETLLERMLEAASRRMIRRRPERTLLPTPELDTDDPVELRFPAAGVVQVPDLRELVSIRFDDLEPLVAGDYMLVGRPHEETKLWVHVLHGRHRFARELVITGRWGPSEVDADVLEACVMWVARTFHQRTARFADNTATPDGGAAGYFRTLPANVKTTLDDLAIPGA